MQAVEIHPGCLRNLDLLRLLRNCGAFGVGGGENQQTGSLKVSLPSLLPGSAVLLSSRGLLHGLFPLPNISAAPSESSARPPPSLSRLVLTLTSGECRAGGGAALLHSSADLRPRAGRDSGSYSFFHMEGEVPPQRAASCLRVIWLRPRRTPGAPAPPPAAAARTHSSSKLPPKTSAHMLARLWRTPGPSFITLLTLKDEVKGGTGPSKAGLV